MRISDWSSDVCSSDLEPRQGPVVELAPDVKFLDGRKTYEDAAKQRGVARLECFGRSVGAEPCEDEWCELLKSGAESGDRKSVVSGKSVSVRVDLVGRRIIIQKK